MTVTQMRKALKGMKGKTPIYFADHDHSKYEWNNKVGHMELLNQEEANSREKIAEEDIIKGEYLILRP